MAGAWRASYCITDAACCDIGTSKIKMRFQKPHAMRLCQPSHLHCSLFIRCGAIGARMNSNNTVATHAARPSRAVDNGLQSDESRQSPQMPFSPRAGHNEIGDDASLFQPAHES